MANNDDTIDGGNADTLESAAPTVEEQIAGLVSSLTAFQAVGLIEALNKRPDVRYVQTETARRKRLEDMMREVDSEVRETFGNIDTSPLLPEDRQHMNVLVADIITTGKPLDDAAGAVPTFLSINGYIEQQVAPPAPTGNDDTVDGANSDTLQA